MTTSGTQPDTADVLIGGLLAGKWTWDDLTQDEFMQVLNRIAWGPSTASGTET